jgi:multiple sugar transport system substrate-binding protein
MSKRVLLTGVAALAAVTLSTASLTASAGATSTTKIATAKAATYPTVPASTQVSISLASYMPLFGTAGINELASLVSGFEALHPNIHVTTQALNNSASIDGTLQQDEVSGNTPDVVQDTFNDLKFVTKDLGAVNLDQVVGHAEVESVFGGQYRYAPAVTHLGEIDGHVYGIPWTLSTPVLFYNANLFTQAGLNPQQPPTTWTALQADALKIKAATGASGFANGCIGAGASGSDWCLQAIVDSYGGSVMNKAQTALTFDNPKTEFAIKEMQGLADAGAMVNLSSAQVVAAWESGKLAFVLNSSALTSTLVAADGGHFQMLATRMPGFGTHLAVPTNSGSALFMLSKQKLQREADWELIQYLTSPQSETTITENIGYPPLRPAIASAPQYLQAWANSNQFLTPNLFQLEHITPWLAYPGPNFAQITTIFTNAATNVIFQDAPLDTTMQGAESQATALLS